MYYFERHIGFFVSFLVFVIISVFLLIPFHTDEVVAVGQIVHSSDYVVIVDTDGEVHKLQDDKLYFSTSDGDDVKVIYKVYRDIFNFTFKHKDIVSFEILNDDCEV